MNPMQLIQMFRSGGNPQQMVMKMLEQQSGSNPMMANLLNLAKSGNTKEIEQFARNVMREQGRDFDKEFEGFRRNYGF